ncbi:hypothetical protein POG22_23725 [Geitlerinema sp. CS-897]|nr:hypothetical protein [Geitlerinema sp. CS-897]
MAKNDSNCHAEGNCSGRLGFGDRDFNLNDNDFVARKPGVVDEWGLGDRLR